MGIRTGVIKICIILKQKFLSLKLWLECRLAGDFKVSKACCPGYFGELGEGALDTKKDLGQAALDTKED